MNAITHHQAAFEAATRALCRQSSVSVDDVQFMLQCMADQLRTALTEFSNARAADLIDTLEDVLIPLISGLYIEPTRS